MKAIKSAREEMGDIKDKRKEEEGGMNIRKGIRDRWE